ncbi:sigma-70 family RNA polymerase sigma factor [Oscillibacter sp.]|uniref:sigma-70 family RNA polymerase sigma factor n=1 Tax=Oscillibacter sp. TaxID=1945593 RepID=UPI0025866E8F|nr:sigma-70 family RNA polymerase sigma factor [Oscillibacter sp.]
MSMRNDGSDPINAIQNRFTAYLITAAKRKKYQYIQKKIRQSACEVSIDDAISSDLWPEEVDMLAGLPPLAQMENQRLLQVLIGLTDRERYVLLAHILDERQFDELAKELGLGYKGVTAVYYRALQKVQKEMRGGRG